MLNNDIFTQIIRQYAPVPVREDELNKYAALAQLLDEHGSNYNLTALKTEEEIAILHMVDSLTLFTLPQFSDIEKPLKVFDIGCGAGFPSLVIAAHAPKYSVTAIDSTAKKIDFVNTCAKETDLAKLSAISARAEELAAQGKFREKSDITVSRGVARLNVLCELCLPFVKVGGYFIAMKGDKGKEEAAEAQKAIKILGGELTDIVDIEIPVFDRNHTAVIIKKTKPTDKKYPRRYSTILKNKL